ncbi:SURF1 family protein [Arsenicitalea aurantiaca]|uniref:SURF1-like protein n=1 Tax=Arsenicitalea aurantiaca TaxID=1783274 RepID=A0A433XAU3_9HYPH|nr:SURF1 family protein [Arsenicitalea aurantiaca]RUT31174.1 SURF1 family protein [Arsenicitalea aurantiaca]
MTQTASRAPISFWAFIILMLGLLLCFVLLGNWQMARLAEKETLIAAVEERLDLPPEPLAPAEAWATTDFAALDYRPVTVTGEFIGSGTVLVFTSLEGGGGRLSGPGYWVMTPMALETGGVVMVNRGFVPQAEGPRFLDQPAPTGITTVSGLARLSEEANLFTPAADVAGRIEWVRDTARLAESVPGEEGPVAPVYLDLFEGKPGELPQAGRTVVQFPNNHLGYAITWYGFALITVPLLGFWIWRQRRPQPQK